MGREGSGYWDEGEKTAHVAVFGVKGGRKRCGPASDHLGRQALIESNRWYRSQKKEEEGAFLLRGEEDSQMPVKRVNENATK